jgi:hypothetical protein
MNKQQAINNIARLIRKYKNDNPQWIETDINAFLNEQLGLETKYSIDILTPQALIECKDNLSKQNASALNWDKTLIQAKTYCNRLILEGEKLPKFIIIIDYKNEKYKQYEIQKVEYFENESEYRISEVSVSEGSIDNLTLYLDEQFIRYDISFDNADKIAQKLYEIYPNLNDSKIFDYLQTSDGNWFYKTQLKQQDFQIKLDLFNDPQTQKKRGAFYTPDRYIKISTQYLRDAIERTKSQGYKDYVIIDRCAGSGQLEKLLTDDELSHCILSTIGISEWVSLWNIYGDKVRQIIPPYINGKRIDPKTKPQDLVKQCDFNKNEVIGADALTEEFLDNFTEIFAKRDKGELAIIMLENPPFIEVAGEKTIKSAMSKNSLTKTYVGQLMTQAKLKVPKGSIPQKSALPQFVWSAFELFNPHYYVCYAPITYWKSTHLIDKTFLNGYICNRKYFHATKSAVSLIYWENKDAQNNTLDFESDFGKVKVRKIKDTQVIYRENAPQEGFAELNYVSTDFVSTVGKLRSIKSDNAWLKGGVKLNRDNLLNQLPIFCSTKFIFRDYTEINILMRSGDGGFHYQNDDDFKNDCLVYSLTTAQNVCLQDNEIYPYGFSVFKQQTKHSNIINLWDKIYGKTKTYGLNNIIKDENNYYTDNKGKQQWIDNELKELVAKLKVELKQFYSTYLRPKILEYELVK